MAVRIHLLCFSNVGHTSLILNTFSESRNYIYTLLERKLERKRTGYMLRPTCKWCNEQWRCTIYTFRVPQLMKQ